jgi:hypothetical protein
VEDRLIEVEKLFKCPNLDKKEIARLTKNRIKMGKYKIYRNEFAHNEEDVYFREINSKNDEAYFSIGFENRFAIASPPSLNILLENAFSSELFSISTYDNKDLGTIKQIATGFYNKRNIYETIYKSFLLKEKEWLKATIGETFTKNLAELFSIDTKQTKTKNFNITKENDFRFIMKMDEKTNVLSPEYKRIGFSGITCPSPKELSSIEIKVFLGPNDTLVEEAKPIGINDNEYPFSPYSPPRPGNIKFEDNSKLSEALEKENILNDFLVNLEQLTDFGYEIYQKVQTNILVGNI